MRRGRDDERLTAAGTATLRAWRAPSPEQDVLRKGYLEHLAVRRAGWSRASEGAHLTASSLVCAPAERQVLLTLHAKLGRWLQTGGHIEAEDGSVEDAALREAEEESGLGGLTLDADPLLLSRHDLRCGGVAAEHLDVQYLVLAPQTSPPSFGAESLDVRWFAPDELPEVDASVRDLVRAASDRLCWG